MSVIHAIILGILQGITEFLPVSSFGHLCAAQHLMGGTRGSGVLFEVMLHIGTMAALILFLWKDIRKIGIELIGMIMDLIGNANIFLYNRRTGKNLTYARIVTGTYRKLTALLIVSTLPTMLIGYQCKRLIVRTAASHMFSGIGLLLTGVILLVVDYSNINGNKGTREADYGDALRMGMLVAGIVGYLVIRFMVNLVNQLKLRYFAFYCFAAGIIVLAANYI